MQVNLEGYVDLIVDKWWDYEKDNLANRSKYSMCKALGVYVAEHIVSTLPITEAFTNRERPDLMNIPNPALADWGEVVDAAHEYAINDYGHIKAASAHFLEGAEWMFKRLLHK